MRGILGEGWARLAAGAQDLWAVLWEELGVEAGASREALAALARLGRPVEPFDQGPFLGPFVGLVGALLAAALAGVAFSALAALLASALALALLLSRLFGLSLELGAPVAAA